MTAVEKVLLEMESRGHHYFDDTLRIGRVFDLLNRARVQQEFEEQRGGRRRRTQIERRVSELDRLARRPGLPAVAGGHGAARRARPRARRTRCSARPTSASFHSDRARLRRLGRPRSAARRRDLRSPARVARRLPMARARPWRRRRRSAPARSDWAPLVTLAATTAAADVTGIVMAGVHGGAGVLHHPGEAAQGPGRDAREGVDRSAPTSRRRSGPVRARAGAQRAAPRRRHRRRTRGSCARNASDGSRIARRSRRCGAASASCCTISPRSVP